MSSSANPPGVPYLLEFEGFVILLTAVCVRRVYAGDGPPPVESVGATAMTAT